MISDFESLSNDDLAAIVKQKASEIPKQAAVEPQQAEWEQAQRVWELRVIPSPPHEDILWAFLHLVAPNVSPG